MRKEKADKEKIELVESDRKLNPRQELFCQIYATDEQFFCNGVQSYIKAYQPKQVGNWYNSARVSAFNLLTKTNILNRINELIESRGLNDAFVDKQLEKMITQDADFKTKVAAIKEYNALKQRVTKKVELSGKITMSSLLDELNGDIKGTTEGQAIPAE